MDLNYTTNVLKPRSNSAIVVAWLCALTFFQAFEQSESAQSILIPSLYSQNGLQITSSLEVGNVITISSLVVAGTLFANFISGGMSNSNLINHKVQDALFLRSHKGYIYSTYSIILHSSTIQTQFTVGSLPIQASEVSVNKPEVFLETKGEKSQFSQSEPSTRTDFLQSKISGNRTSTSNYDRGDGAYELWGNRNRKIRSDKERERLRLELLKHIKDMDHMKCFPKVLCGLSVDSSKTSSGIDSYFVRSYIQLMRSANPEDDSSEETKPSTDNTKDALSLFLMKSGILRPKRTSHSASSSEEDGALSEEPEVYKSPLERKNEALKSLLSKRKLETNDWDSGNKSKLYNIKGQNLDPFRFLPVLHLSSGPTMRQPTAEESQSITSQIGSLVSSWVPWVSLSFGTDSFEKDPFFKGGSALANKNKDEKWKKDLEKLAYLMKLREEEIRNKKAKLAKLKKESGHGPDNGDAKDGNNRQSRDFSVMDDEMLVYSTAVDIGKKLTDTRQCDYLYNGCPVPYADIIKIISSIRKDIKQHEETAEALSKEIFEYAEKMEGSKRPVKAKPKIKPKQPQPTNRKPLQKPMTQISHTLPNGEKVEINVQLSSGKDDVFDDEGEAGVEFDSPFQDDAEEQQEDAGIEPDNEPIFDEDEVKDEEPAISSSYNLDDEKFEDFRKPSPVDIFNKISLKNASTTEAPVPTSTSPKYTVSKKRTKPTSTRTTSKPQTTRKPPTKSPTTTRRPSRQPQPQPTVKPRATTRPHEVSLAVKKQTTQPTTIRTTRATTTALITIKTTKRPTSKLTTITTTKRPQSKFTTIRTTKRPQAKLTTTETIYVTKKQESTRRSTRSTTPASKSTTVMSQKLKTKNRTTKAPEVTKPSTSTTQIVVSNEDEDVSDYTTKHPVTPKTTKTTKGYMKTATTKKPMRETFSSTKQSIIIPGDSHSKEDSGSSGSEEYNNKPINLSNTKGISTSTIPPTTRSTTLPPLAMFTKSYMDEVIEEMYKTVRPPKSNLTLSHGGSKYSVKKRKPSSPYTNPLSVHALEHTTLGSVYISSVESGSGEVMFIVPNDGENGEGPNFSTLEDPKTESKKKTTTTQEPTLFGEVGVLGESGTENGNSENVSGKRKIKYKNPKRPYLILMNNSASLEHQSSKTDSKPKRKRPRPGPHVSKPNYTVKKNSTIDGAQSATGLRPLVFEPGSSEYPYWVPTL